MRRRVRGRGPLGEGVLKRRGQERRRWPSLLTAAVFLVVFVGAVYVLRRPILRGMAEALIVSDSPEPAELIFLLNGRPSNRPFRAASVYHQGFAPRAVIAQVARNPAERLGACEDQTAAAVTLLRQLNVPDSAIVVLPSQRGTTSTSEEAVVLRSYLRWRPADRVLVVTSAYHTRRTRWWLRREIPDETRLIMLPARDTRFDETTGGEPNQDSSRSPTST